MKVINISESTIFLDDINTAIIYSRNKKPTEIENRVAKKSKALRYALKHGLLVDVTAGVPDVLPKPKSEFEISGAQKDQFDDAQKSSFEDKRDFLVSDDPKLGGTGTPPKPAPKLSATGDASKDFEEDGSMSVVWTGPATDAGGFANMNRKMMFGLSERGVNMKYEHLISMNDMDPSTIRKMKRLRTARVPSNAPKVYGMTAPLIYDWARYKMLFTMMETRRLHPDYVERCNSADEIVVPSHWCKHTFEESGIVKPVSVVPLGVDTDIYYPGADPLDFSSSLKDFVFLSVFGWSMRKGYDVLLKAYLEEFTSDDPVSLLISSRYFGSTDETKKQRIRDDVARISSMVENPKKPHVLLFGDVLPIDMMPSLYASADCYVLISRGEGFGLPYIEAAACGLPVIASNYSGQTDFLTSENSYLVGVDGFRRADDSISWISYFYEGAEFPTLGAPAVEQTRYWMRHVYENPDDAKEKAGKLHKKVVEEYNWNTCIDQMHAKLSKTFETLPLWEMKNGKKEHRPNR